jgi:predicted dehydrogenase
LKNRKLRLAVVGLGKMGLLHASLSNVLPEVQLVALCDKSALMARLYKKIFSPAGVIVLKDVNDLSGLNLDAVFITTPISSHFHIIKSLLANEIARNIFVEKTLASTYEQARELCLLAKNVDAITMVGYMKRFNVVFGKAKELLVQETLGEPLSFQAYSYSSDFLGQSRESKSSATRGGALRDIGCHIIDIALWLIGDLEVGRVVSSVKNEDGSETAISFTAHNSAGLEGQFEVSQSVPKYRMPEFGLVVECAKGKLEVNDDRLCLTLKNGVQKRWYRHDLNDNVYFSIGEAEYYREDQLFVSSVLNHQKCEPNFDTASKVDYVIDQVKSRW